MGYKVKSGLGWADGYYVIEENDFKETPRNAYAQIYCVRDVFPMAGNPQFPVADGSWKPATISIPDESHPSEVIAEMELSEEEGKLVRWAAVPQLVLLSTHNALSRPRAALSTNQRAVLPLRSQSEQR